MLFIFLWGVFGGTIPDSSDGEECKECSQCGNSHCLGEREEGSCTVEHQASIIPFTSVSQDLGPFHLKGRVVGEIGRLQNE